MSSFAPTSLSPSTQRLPSSAYLLNRAQAVSRWIDLHPAKSFTILTVFYLLVVSCLSYVKLLWLDELITLHIARLNSAKAIWNALALGADPNPPVIHLAVMLSRRLFGEHALALRLPAIFGYWLGMLAFFLFLKHRLPSAWALTGTVLTLGMDGFEWSYESRSYAIFYGFTMLALYCWACASGPYTTASRRAITIAGMTLSLAAGLCTNYFSVLAFFPIAAAEITRTILQVLHQPRSSTGSVSGKIRWSIWIALAVAATPLLLFRSLIKTSIALYAPYAWNKVSLDAISGGYLDIVSSMLYPLGTLVLCTILVWWLGPICASASEELRPRWLNRLAITHYAGENRGYPFTAPETAAIAVLLTYPFVGYLVASIRGGMLSPRFVIPVCFGVAAVGILLAFHLFGHMRAASAIALLSAVIWFATREAYVGFTYEVQKESFFRVVSHLPEIMEPGEPLVVADNLLVLPLRFYAPSIIASRIIYPIDFPGIMRRRGEAASEINLWTGRSEIYDLPIIPLASLQQGTGTYPIVTGEPDWIVEDLRRHLYLAEPLEVDSEAAFLDSGTTPLSHGKPYFYWASREQERPSLLPLFPIPFDLRDNMPSNRPLPRNNQPERPAPFR